MPVQLPPVGIITLRERGIPAAAEQLIDCLRLAVGELGRPAPRRRKR